MKNKEITYSVGQLAKILKVSVCTLQRYDNQNLLPAHRNENGRRYYTEADIEKYHSVKKNYVAPDTMSVSQFANWIKASVNYVQKIDNLGYVKAHRTESGYRYYDYSDRLKYCRQCGMNEINMEKFYDITDFYTPKEFAEIVGTSVTTLRDYHKNKKYVANIRPGRKVLYFYTNNDIDYFNYRKFYF